MTLRTGRLGRFTSLLLLVGMIATPLVEASAQATAPTAHALDGVTLDLGGVRHRLHGVAPPVGSGPCFAPGDAPCPEVARRLLQLFMDGAAVVCARMGDGPGHTVSLCTADGADLGELMVMMGWARAADDLYAEPERFARENGFGVWRRGRW